jgi:hypothetical protein
MRYKWAFVKTFLAASLVATGTAAADSSDLTSVPNANPKTPGFAAPNILSPELTEIIAAQGSIRLENGSALTNFYGYDNDGPMLPLPGAVQSPGHNVEATKTEPDKNTYLVLEGQHGADPNYDYGTHFLFQGHENGQGGKGYLTRINLDADGAHRVTLLATTDKNGQSLPTIDGSTWDPWAQRLLFAAELGNNGGVWQATPDYPSAVEDISGIFGRAGYEGIQNDSDGNVWIVEDTGGPTGTINTHARQPNSFVYRFIPYNPTDLTQGGKLQALQVISLANPGQPIVFHPGAADADILSQDEKDLHTYGKVFTTNWITIHDTAVDGNAPFNANALAKAKNATPFKRPENGQFRPGKGFTQFFFDETGDTNALTEASSDFGGFGSVLKLTQKSPSANTGKLTLFYKCDVVHTAFDNVAFWSRDEVVFVEDAGDTLHTQRNALDSGYLFDVTADYSTGIQPIRILAEGRDASATLDSGLGSVSGSGFQNDGDNEITGIHVSDGDPTTGGILGARKPNPFFDSWRVFFTQQHGDNITWEIIPAPQNQE